MRLMILLTALLVAPAAAESDLETCPVEPSLFAELTAWIEENTHYPVRSLRTAAPAIALCSEGDVIDYEGEDLIVEHSIRALYDLEKERIILVKPWDPEEPMDVSRLLHEMIHHVQWAERDWRCKTEPEVEAYKLQERWLAEQGVDSGFNWLFIYLRARCHDIHP